MKLWSLIGNSQQLDGGAMFGNAPRAMWSRWIAPDVPRSTNEFAPGGAVLSTERLATVVPGGLTGFTE